MFGSNAATAILPKTDVREKNISEHRENLTGSRGQTSQLWPCAVAGAVLYYSTEWLKCTASVTGGKAAGFESRKHIQALQLLQPPPLAFSRWKSRGWLAQNKKEPCLSCACATSLDTWLCKNKGSVPGLLSQLALDLGAGSLGSSIPQVSATCLTCWRLSHLSPSLIKDHRYYVLQAGFHPRVSTLHW